MNSRKILFDVLHAAGLEDGPATGAYRVATSAGAEAGRMKF